MKDEDKTKEQLINEEVSKMGEGIRKTGIDIIGDAPWGTHLCLFYKTKKDLIDILVPYFKAGLENNEFCIWVTSQSLREKEAKKAMRKAVPNFDRYLKRGQIEIIPYTKWYLKDGTFNLKRVLNAWIDKLNQALAKDYDGMRVTGNTAWLEKGDWRKFTYYEEEANDSIGKYRMMAICTYCLDKCGTSEVIDVVSNHQFALIKREGKWEIIKSSERKRAEEASRIKDSAVASSINAIAIADLEGNLTYINKSFLKLWQYDDAREVLGKPAVQFWQMEEKAAKVVEALRDRKSWAGELVAKRKDGSLFDVHLSASMVKDEAGKPICMMSSFVDITERKWAEEALQESEGKLSAMLGSIGDHMSMMDRDLNITWANETAKKIFGNDIIGKKCYEAYHQREEPCESCITLQSFQDGGIHEHDTQVIGKDGQTMWFHCTANVALKDHRGNPTAVLEISRDITEHKRAEEAIKRLAKISSEDPNPVLRVGGNGTVLYANQGSLPLLNLWGCQIGQLLPEYWRKFILDVLRSGLSRNIEVECEDHIFSLTFVPIRGANYVNLYGLDITERKWAEEALRKAEQEKVAILDSMSEHVVFQDLEHQVIWANKAAGESVGLAPEELAGRYCYEIWQKSSKPCIGCPVAKARKTKQVQEAKMTTPDGRAWFIRGYPIKDANDNVAAMVEVTLETTERKQAEEALRESEEKFDAMLRSIGDHMSMMDKDLNIVWANETAKKIFGNDIIGKKCYEAYHQRKEPCEPYPCLTLKAFQDGKVHEHDTQVMDKDGKIIHFHCTANVALRDKEGKPTAVIEISRDTTEHKRMEEVLRASEQRYRDLYKKAKLLAERDPLTKLFNHRRISELLENEIERAKRKEEVFSIMMLDVDDLKLINDAYGHVAGDKLLKNIADIFKNSCRSIDLIGRYGGDEFLIILPYTDGEKAKNIAQRICEKIRKQGLKINGTKNIPTRLSIGVATYPFDSMISRELISLADGRMYESKRSGKSVVSVSTPEIKKYLLAKKPTLNILESLVTAVDGKDHYTKAHVELVNKFSFSLAKQVNLSHEEMEALRIAALLHDIGKIGVPENILRKPGPLEREEFELIKQHPILGAMMLDGPPLHRDHVIDAIKYHHERYDGKGYPGELKGKDIPLLARIIGIVDAYCAMITDRPYRKALTQEGAIAELKKGAGTQFDPELVDKFIKCLKDLKERKF